MATNNETIDLRGTKNTLFLESQSYSRVFRKYNDCIHLREIRLLFIMIIKKKCRRSILIYIYIISVSLIMVLKNYVTNFRRFSTSWKFVEIKQTCRFFFTLVSSCLEYKQRSMDNICVKSYVLLLRISFVFIFFDLYCVITSGAK